MGSKTALLFIKIYRLLLSPLLGGQCRFIPSCSHYAEEAFKKYPPVLAIKKVAFRLMRCHPFSRGGFDPA